MSDPCLSSSIYADLVSYTLSVLTVQMACLALAFDWSRIRRSMPLLPGGRSTSMISQPAASFGKALLAVLSVLSVLGTLYRLPSSAPVPYKQGPRVFNAGIWTLHFGMDNTGRDSQRGVAQLIRYGCLYCLVCSALIGLRMDRDMELDVIGLLETDLHVWSCLFPLAQPEDANAASFRGLHSDIVTCEYNAVLVNVPPSRRMV